MKDRIQEGLWGLSNKPAGVYVDFRGAPKYLPAGTDHAAGQRRSSHAQQTRFVCDGGSLARAGILESSLMFATLEGWC